MAPKSWAEQSQNDKKLYGNFEIVGNHKNPKNCLKGFGAEIRILIICIGVIKNHKLKKLAKYNHSSFLSLKEILHLFNQFCRILVRLNTFTLQ